MDLPYVWNQSRRGWEDHHRRVFKGTAGGTAICFSACDDKQTSADTTHFARTTATGAMTYCFIQAVEHVPNATYETLMQHMIKTLKSAKGGGGGGLAMDPAAGLLGMLIGGAFSSALASGGAGFRQHPQISSDKKLDLRQPFHL